MSGHITESADGQGTYTSSKCRITGEFGIPEDRITTLRNAGIGLDNWLTGFTDVEDSVHHTVGMIRRHPLMPNYIPVHGLVIHPTTGKLALIVNGKTECAVNPA